MRRFLALTAALFLCAGPAYCSQQPMPAPKDTAALAHQLVETLYRQANEELERKELQKAREHLEQALLIVFDFHLDKPTEDKIRGSLTQLRIEHRGNVSNRQTVTHINMNRYGQFPFQSDDPDEQEFLYLESLNYAERHLPAYSGQLAKRLAELEKFYRRVGDKESARGVDTKLIAMLDKARTAQDASDIADQCIDAAAAAAQARDVLDAKLLGQPVITYLESLDDKNYSRSLAARLSQLGSAFQTTGDRSDAEKFLKAAISLDGGENEPRLFNDRLALAKIYEDEGKYNQAIEMREMALAKADGNNTILSCYVSLSRDYLHLNDPAKAKTAAAKIADKLPFFRIENDWNLVNQLGELSGDFAEQKDLATATLLYSAMFDIALSTSNRSYAYQMISNNFRKLVNQFQAVDPKAADQLLVSFTSKFAGHAGADEAQAVQTVAQCYIDRHQFDKAVALAQDYLKASESSGGRVLLSNVMQIARMLDGAGEQKSALQLRKEICDEQTKSDLKDDTRLANLCELATAASGLGDAATARAAIASAIKIIQPILQQRMPSSADLVCSTINDLSASQVLTAACLLQSAQRHAMYQQNSAKTALLEEMANYLGSGRDYEKACKLYSAVLEAKAQKNGPSSSDAMAVMIPYAVVLRNAGKVAEADSMQEGIDAIQTLLNEQKATGRTVLRPFAPLKETIQSLRRAKGMET